MRRLALVVSGKVQGVGFRYFTQYLASRNRITGRVMNLDDGTVSLEIQGTEQDLDEFIDSLWKGEGLIRVTGMDQTEMEPVAGETRFRVQY